MQWPKDLDSNEISRVSNKKEKSSRKVKWDSSCYLSKQDNWKFNLLSNNNVSLFGLNRRRWRAAGDADREALMKKKINKTNLKELIE